MLLNLQNWDFLWLRFSPLASAARKCTSVQQQHTDYAECELHIWTTIQTRTTPREQRAAQHSDTGPPQHTGRDPQGKTTHCCQT
jgi:hypothetical protein